MITRKTTIDQHIGTHPTGMRMTRLYDVITECEEDDAEWIDELHSARVAYESLDSEPRARALERLASLDHDAIDEVEAYRIAVRYARSCEGAGS